METAMQLTSVVTPFTDNNLQLLSQIGVTHTTIRYPGSHVTVLSADCQICGFDHITSINASAVRVQRRGKSHS